MKIQLHENESVSSDSVDSVDSVNPDMIIETLQEEITKFDMIFEKVEEHMKSFETRIKQLNKYSLIPLTQDVHAWCEKKGLVAPFSLDDWFKVVLSDTESTDLKTRMLYFKNPVPWTNKNINVFDLLRGVLKWFYFTNSKTYTS